MPREVRVACAVVGRPEEGGKGDVLKRRIVDLNRVDACEANSDRRGWDTQTHLQQVQTWRQNACYQQRSETDVPRLCRPLAPDFSASPARHDGPFAPPSPSLPPPTIRPRARRIHLRVPPSQQPTPLPHSPPPGGTLRAPILLAFSTTPPPPGPTPPATARARARACAPAPERVRLRASSLEPSGEPSRCAGRGAGGAGRAGPGRAKSGR